MICEWSWKKTQIGKTNKKKEKKKGNLLIYININIILIIWRVIGGGDVLLVAYKSWTSNSSWHFINMQRTLFRSAENSKFLLSALSIRQGSHDG